MPDPWNGLLMPVGTVLSYAPTEFTKEEGPFPIAF